MRVFPDTNVLVSAFATRGLCADVVRLALAEHELMTSDVVLGELRRVLTNKIGAPADRVAVAVGLLEPYATTTRPKASLSVQGIDDDDHLVLASALAAGAEVFVTGDRALLELQSLQGMVLEAPRAFWTRVTARG